ncbi:hypothetical protein QA601_08995 [Chitinispirillales bacterium ANBcel5]|uniref:hypothetical protein n=1 Tax=Cellulosispirillum alkaliphilum TaxID=3039283 RepID=UPI002A4F20B8|nr:hypothetical protein [Chitinispirillales bacterium ANBcel5]
MMWILLGLTTMGLILITLHFFTRKSKTGKVYFPYIKRKTENGNQKFPLHLYVAICNHYSPFWNGVSQEIAEHRVITWCREYRNFANKHRDSNGKRPVHTIFYDEQQYNAKFLDSFSKLCWEGLADVELLLESGGNSGEQFSRRIEDFRDVLFHHHGLLRKDRFGEIRFGAIHKSTSANKSAITVQDNTELFSILKSSGCLALFNSPYTHKSSQKEEHNGIYFIPQNGYDDLNSKRTLVFAGLDKWIDNELLYIQGPMALNWRNRVCGLIPRVEDGELGNWAKVTPQRVQLWVKCPVKLQGISNHIFIKLHTFGAVDSNVRYIFGENGYHSLCSELEQKYNDGERYKLHYVSAYQMYSKIRQLCLKEKMAGNTQNTP